MNRSFEHSKHHWLIATLTGVGLLANFNATGFAHEGHVVIRANSSTLNTQLSSVVEEANAYFQLFTALVAEWPNPLKDDLIAQAAAEQQIMRGDPDAMPMDRLRICRNELCRRLETLLPTIHVDWNESSASVREAELPLIICRSISAPLLTIIHNQTDHDLVLRALPNTPFTDSRPPIDVRMAAGSEMVLLSSLCLEKEAGTSNRLEILLEERSGQGSKRAVSIPVNIVEPAVIRGTVREGTQLAAARVTVQCDDGVCRYGGEFAGKSTFTDKPIIYPPIGTAQKTRFFYTKGEFEMLVPPGKTSVTVERGFEHERSTTEMDSSL